MSDTKLGSATYKNLEYKELKNMILAHNIWARESQ